MTITILIDNSNGVIIICNDIYPMQFNTDEATHMRNGDIHRLTNFISIRN